MNDGCYLSAEEVLMRRHFDEQYASERNMGKVLVLEEEMSASPASTSSSMFSEFSGTALWNQAAQGSNSYSSYHQYDTSCDLYLSDHDEY